MQNQPDDVPRTIKTNERTIIRAIVKWSRPAAIAAVAVVLLAAAAWVRYQHQAEIESVEGRLTTAQQEAKETKSQLNVLNSEKSKLNTEKLTLEKEVAQKDEKIRQLEQENKQLK